MKSSKPETREQIVQAIKEAFPDGRLIYDEDRGVGVERGGWYTAVSWGTVLNAGVGGFIEKTKKEFERLKV